MKKFIFLGVMLVFVFVISSCGNETSSGNRNVGTNSVSSGYEEFDFQGMKDFVTKKETGYVMFSFENKKEEADLNRIQVENALKNHNQKMKFLDYRKNVTDDKRLEFLQEVSKQHVDSLGYYKDGILLGDFSFQNKWNSEQINELNQFIKQMTGE